MSIFTFAYRRKLERELASRIIQHERKPNWDTAEMGERRGLIRALMILDPKIYAAVSFDGAWARCVLGPSA